MKPLLHRLDDPQINADQLKLNKMTCDQAKEAHSAYIIAFATQYCTEDVMSIGNQTMFIFQYFLNSSSLKMSIEEDIVLEPIAVLHMDLALYTKTPIIPDLHELDDPTIMIAPHIFHHPHMSASIIRQTSKQSSRKMLFSSPSVSRIYLALQQFKSVKQIS